MPNEIPASVYRYAFLFAATLILIFAGLYRFYYNKLENNNISFSNHLDKLGGSSISEISKLDNRFSGYLHEYNIMSSFNSCCGGNITNDYVDINPLINTISRGARLLDFEIFQKDNQAVVAAGLGRDEGGQCLLKGTFNHLPIKKVFNAIAGHAFSSTSPNPKDPLFLHFRFCTNNNAVYYQIAEGLKEYFSTRLLSPKYGHNGRYASEENNILRTKLTNLKGKVIILCSDENRGYKDSELTPYINLSDSMGSVFSTYTNSQIIMSANDKQSRIEKHKKTMALSIPDITNKIKNSTFGKHIEQGIHFVCINYAQGEYDDNLREAIDFFEKNGTAFVKKENPLLFREETIPEPKKQDKRVSMATKKIDLPMYQGTI